MKNENNATATATIFETGHKMKTTIINSTMKGLGVSGLALAMAMSATPAAFAAITNTATANGTPARGTLTPPTDSESVPVEPAAPAVNIVKSIDSVTVANGADATIEDAGDIITYRYVVTNTGSTTLTNVTPVDSGPTFNGTAGTASLSGFTFDGGASTAASAASVAPGETAVFTATYTMSTQDYLLGSQVDDGVDNSATATSDETPTSNTSTAEYNLPANPDLTITKSAALTEVNGTVGDGEAAVGDTITYTYTVENTGNVVMSNVTISDDHENGEPGAVVFTSAADMNNETLTSDGPLAPGTVSSDAATDGSWDTLQPGAIITFTYTHTVTQAEFDSQ